MLAGVDATAAYVHTDRLTSTLRASYLWAKNLGTSEPFVGLPPADVRYRLEYRLPRWGGLDESSWNGGVQYTFRQWQAPRTVPLSTLLRAGQTDEALFAAERSAFDILSPPPGYVLVNLAWSGQIDNFQLGVQGRNVLNQRYRSYTDRLRYFADEMGRNVVVSVKYAF